MLDIANEYLVINHANINDYLPSTLTTSVSTEMLNKISTLAMRSMPEHKDRCILLIYFKHIGIFLCYNWNSRGPMNSIA